MSLSRRMRHTACVLTTIVTGLATGCRTVGPDGAEEPRTPFYHPAPKAGPGEQANLPKELDKTTMPPYVVEPPDILLIDAQRLVPLPPYKVEPLDVLYLNAPGASEKFPINGMYSIDPDGTIDLGPNYGGSIRVIDMTVPEIQGLMAARLKNFLKDNTVSVSIAQSRGLQTIRGEHLVRPDGTVSLGLYGSVYVTGMTLPQTKAAIEQHLSRYLQRPEVSVDVGAYNSKYYYVVTDFAGSGEQVVRLPSTGNETVLDAISQVGGLSAVSTKRIWVARPAPGCGGDQILPVDWKGITRRGTTQSNYQILPGDRIFVMGQPLTKVDTTIARVTAPVERVMGTALFGTTTVRTIQSGSTNLFGNNGTTVNVNGSTTSTTR